MIIIDKAQRSDVPWTIFLNTQTIHHQLLVGSHTVLWLWKQDTSSTAGIMSTLSCIMTSKFQS